jgi:hypothetical protein
MMHNLDEIILSKYGDTFFSKSDHPERKKSNIFWIRHFGWIRNVSLKNLSKKTILDGFFGYVKERPKECVTQKSIQKNYFGWFFWIR